MVLASTAAMAESFEGQVCTQTFVDEVAATLNNGNGYKSHGISIIDVEIESTTPGTVNEMHCKVSIETNYGDHRIGTMSIEGTHSGHNTVGFKLNQ